MAFTTRALLCLDITLTQTGNGNTDSTMTRALGVKDISGLPTVSQAGGTTVVQVYRQALGAGSFNALSSSMAFATSGSLARTTQVIAAERVIAATDVLRTTVSGETGGPAADGHVFVEVFPLPITGN